MGKLKQVLLNLLLQNILNKERLTVKINISMKTDEQRDNEQFVVI